MSKIPYCTCLLFCLFFIISCSDQSELYDSAKSLTSETNPIIKEIIRQNPQCRLISSISQFDFKELNPENKFFFIHREEPEAVKEQQKDSRYVLLVTPRPFSFSSNKQIHVKEAQRPSRFIDLKEYCKRLKLSNSFYEWEMYSATCYTCYTKPYLESLYNCFISVYTTKEHVFLLIDMDRNGLYVPDEADPNNEYKWKWVPRIPITEQSSSACDKKSDFR